MTITELNTAFQNIVTYLKSEGHKVGGHQLVAEDGHAVNKLKDHRDIWIIVVMPSTTYSGQSDQQIAHDTLMLFVLEKDVSGQTNEKELQQYQRTEDVLQATIDYISDQQSEGCSPFDRFDPASITIDPEYRIFGGWNGWSMTLSY